MSFYMYNSGPGDRWGFDPRKSLVAFSLTASVYMTVRLIASQISLYALCYRLSDGQTELR